MKSFLSVFKISIMVLVIYGCGNDDQSTLPQQGYVSFLASATRPGTSDGRTNDSDLPAFVIYTLKKSDGSTISDKIELYEFNGNYITQPFNLTATHYSLEQFLILDVNNETIYAAPVAGSELADRVEHPLPLSFIVSTDQLTHLTPEVIAVANNTPEDFGYLSFGFEIKDIDSSGLTRFDYTYMPDDPFDATLHSKIASYTLSRHADIPIGWNINFVDEHTKARIAFRYNNDGLLVGADRYTFADSYKKVQSIEFDEYTGSVGPMLAHLYSWAGPVKTLEYDIHFTYDNSRLFTFREDNFKGADAYYVFIDHVLHYDEAGNISEHNANGEYVSSGAGGTMHYDRQYTYDEKPNILTPAFDPGKAICFYALNNYDMWNEDAFAKLLSVNNYIKAQRKPMTYDDPMAYDRRRGEHSRKLFYDTSGKLTHALNEYFYWAPFDPELQMYPMTSSQAFEAYKINP
jgi:hypothetical protein